MRLKIAVSDDFGAKKSHLWFLAVAAAQGLEIFYLLNCIDL